MTRLAMLLASLLVGCGPKQAAHTTAYGIHDSLVFLQGDPSLAVADADIIAGRLGAWGYPGQARAVDGQIEVTIPMPAGVRPDRILGRVLRPGQLSIHHEVEPADGAPTLDDCTAAKPACETVSVGPSLLTNSHVARSTLMPDPTGPGYSVLIEFTPEGGAILQSATKRALGKRMVIQVDGVILSRPVIQTAIEGGQAMIHIGPGVPEHQLGHAKALLANIQGPALRGTWTVRPSP